MLATIQTQDFIYVCDNHLTDPGFASQVGQAHDGVGASGAKLGLSKEDIAQVKKEWEERQKKKQDRAKEKEKEKDKDKDKQRDIKDASNADGKDSSKSPSPPKSAGPLPSSPADAGSPATKPAHERYTLHRDIFALRLAEHRKRRQAAQAKELAPRLPGAPKANLPPPSLN